MIARVLAPLIALLRAWRVAIPVCAGTASLDCALGTGWILRWDPATLAERAATPVFVAALLGYPVLRGVLLLAAARALCGRGLAEPARILGVAWSEFVARSVPVLAVLAFGGPWSGMVEFKRLDVVMFACFWYGANASADLLPVWDPARWGVCADVEPAAYVLGRAARPEGGRQSWPGPLAFFFLASLAGYVRVMVVVLSTGVFADGLPSGALRDVGGSVLACRHRERRK